MLHPPFLLGLIMGGAVIYWFTGASMQAVSTGAYRAVEFIKRNIKLEGSKRLRWKDSKKVVEICTQYAQKGMFNIFMVRLLLHAGLRVPRAVLLHGLPDLDRGLRPVPGDLHGQRRRRLGQRQEGGGDGTAREGHRPARATVVGDTVGDPFKDTSSVALNPIIKFTTLFGLLAVELAVSMTAQQGCQVFSFKAPSSEELDHDYLWRCMKRLPERGRIGIFNRSYYEEVLVARVHPAILERQNLPKRWKDKHIWKRRFQEINNFEEYLTHNGIEVVKIFLNVSKEEQKKRFLERIDRPDKNWKFSDSDVRERAHWDAYIKAYEDCLRATSTEHAPWYVIPADNKWFTRLAVAYVIYRKLKSLNLAYPEVSTEQRESLQDARRHLESEP
jgi:PPK2 family polyphosphate:nucleotide phosphotransferase